MNRLALSFLAVAGLASFTASCTDARRCELGTLECLCAAGTCEDGARCVDDVCEACPLGAEDCACASGVCNAGLTCVTSEDRCVQEEDTVCEDSCFSDWHDDGYCDDGGAASMYSSCNLGSDCTDCGPRRNPCLNPDFPTFCPETPDAPTECWSPLTDCDSIVFCGDDPTPHACNVGFRYDCAAESCVANVCSGTEFPVFCEYDATCASSGTNCCFRTNTDCRTATMCHGAWYACRGRRTISALEVSCGAAAENVACVLPATPE